MPEPMLDEQVEITPVEAALASLAIVLSVGARLVLSGHPEGFHVLMECPDASGRAVRSLGIYPDLVSLARGVLMGAMQIAESHTTVIETPTGGVLVTR